MNLLINIVMYLSYLMEGYIACMYFTMMFEPRNKFASSHFCLYSVGFSLLYFVYFLKSAVVNMVCVLIVMTVAGMVGFYANWFKALFHSAVVSVLLVACETLVIALYNLLFAVNAASVNTPLVVVFVSITSKLILLGICRFIRIFSVKDKTVNKWNVILFAVPVASFLCMLINFNQSARLQLNFYENVINCIASVMLLSSNILVFYVYERALKNEQELSAIRLSEQRRELDYEHYRMLEEHRNESRVIIHDIKHHLNLIRCMAWESNDTDVARYIDSFQQTSYFANPSALSGNKIADAVLSQKRRICQEKGIMFSFEHNNADLSFVNDYDLCAIISNAMDNAIESAVKSNDKYIAVRFYSSENNCFCFLEFVNSCDTEPVKNSKGFLSAKSGRYHGVGLYSIKHAAEKYAGEMVTQYTQEKMFYTTVMLQRENICNK